MICRVCESSNLATYLDLGRLPLANGLKTDYAEQLAVVLCRNCGLSQLTAVVDRHALYDSYFYVSSTPQTFRDHCRDLVKAVGGTGGRVLDIGSNDGCLLAAFARRGFDVIGVEPAKNLVKQSKFATYNGFWGKAAATLVGHADLVTSLNVLGHVDDVHDFVRCVKMVLRPGGRWLIEVPWIVDLIQNTEFDTIYHEHLSYWSVHALNRLVRDHDLQIYRVDRFPKMHGGTIRVWVSRPHDYVVDKSVNNFLNRERAFNLFKLEPYKAFTRRIAANKKRLLTKLKRYKTVWIYGASAKGSTLMNSYGLDIPVALDDNHKKWGYCMPGSKTKIMGINALRTVKVDALLLLAWNFKDEIIRRCRDVGYKGVFVSPV